MNAHEAAKRNIKVREMKAANLYAELYLKPYIACEHGPKSALPLGGTKWTKKPRTGYKARNRALSKVSIPNSMPDVNYMREYLRGERD